MSFESSMSQVAATMGITASEIAGGSEDYNILANAAKAAGAATKYSASQAAEALNYLALAGYDAKTAADVLPSVLNLAAAGGIDLAYASDLATDAMAALGIEASNENLTHFGDELAKTSQKSNTSVAQLGEAILVCAGTAKNAGQSLETVNTALGVMANRGIKGSEGGTHLRNVLLSLTSPTDVAAKKLKELNVSAADSDGNIRSLDDIISDLNGSLKDMSEEAKLNALSTIFNKTDISAVNALLDGTGQEWDDLKKQIMSADGAMADMAETMNDNLQGKITIFGSALEGLGIAVYEGMQQPLKNAVDIATDCVGRLSNAFSEGELQAALTNVGSLMGSLVSDIAGGLSNAISAAVKLLAFFGEHINGVASIIGGILPAFALLKTAWTFGPVISKTVTAVKEATGAFQKFGAVLGVNPWVALVAAVVAATAAIAIFVSRNANAEGSINALCKDVKETSQAFEDLKKSQNEKINGKLYDIAQTQQYADELRKLVDENGRVKTSDQERARFLMNELNQALGLEMEMTDGVISKYEELKGNIDELILKKKAQAVLDTLNESEAENLKGRAKAWEEYTESVNKLNEAKKKQAENEAKGNFYAADIANVTKLKKAVDSSKQSYLNYNQEIAASSNLTEAIISGDSTKIQDALNQVAIQSTVAGQRVASDTQEALSIIKSNISDSLTGINTMFEQSGDTLIGANKEAFDSAATNLKGLIEQYKQTGGDLSSLKPVFEAAGVDLGTVLGDGTESGVEAGQAGVTASAENVVTTAAELAGVSALTEGQYIGKNLSDGVAAGITSGGINIATAARNAVTAAKWAMMKVSVIESPSHVFRDEVGLMLAKGVAVGITKGVPEVEKSSGDLINSVISAAEKEGEIHSPSRVMRDEVGVMLVEGLKVGILSKIDEVPEAFEKLMDDIKLQLDLGAITESEYYKKLEGYRDEYLTKGSDEWWNYTKEIIKYEEELTEQQKDREFKRLDNLKSMRFISEAEYYKQLEGLRDKYFTKGSDDWEDYTLKIAGYYSDTLNDMVSKYTDMLADVHSKQESLQDKLKGSIIPYYTATLDFTEKDKWGRDVPYELETVNLFDLDNQLQQLKSYGERLNALKNRDGSTDSIVAAVLDAGDMGGEFLNKLLRLSDTEFKKYVSDYQKYLDEADKIGREFYADEEQDIISSAESYADSFINGIQDNLTDLDTVMKDAGLTSAQAFINEFMAQINAAVLEAKQIIAAETGSANYQYNTYQIAGGSDTTAQQLRACRNAAKVEQLRGGYV